MATMTIGVLSRPGCCWVEIPPGSKFGRAQSWVSIVISGVAVGDARVGVPIKYQLGIGGIVSPHGARPYVARPGIRYGHVQRQCDLGVMVNEHQACGSIHVGWDVFGQYIPGKTGKAFTLEQYGACTSRGGKDLEIGEGGGVVKGHDNPNRLGDGIVGYHLFQEVVCLIVVGIREGERLWNDPLQSHDGTLWILAVHTTETDCLILFQGLVIFEVEGTGHRMGAFDLGEVKQIRMIALNPLGMHSAAFCPGHECQRETVNVAVHIVANKVDDPLTIPV